MAGEELWTTERIHLRACACKTGWGSFRCGDCWFVKACLRFTFSTVWKRKYPVRKQPLRKRRVWKRMGAETDVPHLPSHPIHTYVNIEIFYTQRNTMLTPNNHLSNHLLIGLLLVPDPNYLTPVQMNETRSSLQLTLIVKLNKKNFIRPPRVTNQINDNLATVYNSKQGFSKPSSKALASQQASQCAVNVQNSGVTRPRRQSILTFA